ncbi:MAG TPA: acyltransferase family protein [Ilumatobacter sp.]|nr:acyltransferase family protein [Ilumatobacter sp.]
MATASDGTTHTRIGGLDGLRGLAVAAVLLFHDDLLIGGFLGVDLFFALSGFLITGLLLAEHERAERVDLVAFWKRRARRLLPAALSFLVLITPLMYVFGDAAQAEAARDGVIPAMFYVANWAQIADSAQYWALFTEPSPLTHLWSLAVEEQFYVLWPLIAIACLRGVRARRTLGLVTAAAVLASFVAMLVLFDPDSPTRVYMGTDTRAASILVGAVAAIVAVDVRLRRLASRAPMPVAVGQVVLLGGVVAMWATIDGSSSVALYRGLLLAHSIACAVLAASMSLGHRTPVIAALEISPLRWIGTVSYGLYLWHWPVFIIIDQDSTGWSRPVVTVVRWSVSLAIAAVSYRFLEAPIRYGRRLAPARAGWSALAVAAVLVVVSAVVTPEPPVIELSIEASSITLPNQSSADTPAVTSPSADTPAVATTTQNTADTSSTVPADTVPATTVPATTVRAPTTTLLSESAAPLVESVAWQGDSVAFDAAPGVIAALSASGPAVTAQTFLGLGLVDERSMGLFVDPFAAEPPDVAVFMLSGWDGGHDDSAQADAFDRYADAWSDLGTVLVVLEPPPVDPSRHENTTDTMLGVARERAAEFPDEVVVLDADELWGDFATDIDGDGQPERKPDGVHVCPTGAALLGYWLSNELAQRFSGIVPADPSVWVVGAWVNDARYDEPPGACR